MSKMESPIPIRIRNNDSPNYKNDNRSLIRKNNSRDPAKSRNYIPRDKTTYEEVKLQMRNKKLLQGGNSDVSKIKNNFISKEKENNFEVDENSNIEDIEQLSSSEEAFLYAVSRNRVEDAENLLNAGVNVHVHNGFKRDAAQIASRNGSVSMLKLLYKNGANMTTNKGVHGDTLFHLAAGNGHVHALKYLHSIGM